MTALTIVQKACARLGITSPSAVFSSIDALIIQMRNLLNQEGAELAKQAEWTPLIKEKTFTTTAAAVQTGAVASDFDWYINESMWNRTTFRPITGPMSAADWQARQALSVGALPDIYFRFRGGDILFYPAPAADQTVAYEYITQNWAETSGGSGLSAMTADTDVTVLDENLHVLGILWRFKMAKGLDYGEYFRTYEIEKAKAIARDGGKPRLFLSSAMASPNMAVNIPSGSWDLS